MRLVNADALIAELGNDINYEFDRDKKHALYHCTLRIENAPTAYNVEAVIEEMKRYMGCNADCKEKFGNGKGCKVCAWTELFEIVRKGGVE